MSGDEAQLKHEKESGSIKAVFIEKLDIEEDVADILVGSGFTSLKEVAYTDIEDLTAIEEFTQEIAEELQSRANDALLLEELSGEAVEPDQDLLDLEGMTEELALQLAENGVLNREELAELSVDELDDLLGLDHELAAQLIMSARAHWFDEE